jgi:hypothetical protein
MITAFVVGHPALQVIEQVTRARAHSEEDDHRSANADGRDQDEHDPRDRLLGARDPGACDRRGAGSRERDRSHDPQA